MDFNVGDGLPRKPSRFAECLPAQAPLLADLRKSLADHGSGRLGRERVFGSFAVGEPARRDAERGREALDRVDARQGLPSLNQEDGTGGHACSQRCGRHAEVVL